MIVAIVAAAGAVGTVTADAAPVIGSLKLADGVCCANYLARTTIHSKGWLRHSCPVRGEKKTKKKMMMVRRRKRIHRPLCPTHHPWRRGKRWRRMYH